MLIKPISHVPAHRHNAKAAVALDIVNSEGNELCSETATAKRSFRVRVVERNLVTVDRVVENGNYVSGHPQHVAARVWFVG